MDVPVRVLPAILLTALLSACASDPIQVPPLADGEIFAVGLYRYEDGDRFRWRCSAASRCDDSLIRDQTLQRLIEQRRIGVRRVILIVRRVDACGPDGSEVACVRGGRDALKIVRWIEPSAN